MPELYYGTDQLEIIEKLPVMDEIEMTMSAFNCVLPDDGGIYCSSDLTTGKWLYYELLKKNNASSPEDLIERVGKAAFRKLREPFFNSNIDRGKEFARELRERGLVHVVTPCPFSASKFSQDNYLYLWEWLIKDKIYEVWFSQDWEYSNGCTLEYAIAARKGIPRLDRKGNALSLKSAIESVGAAVDELRKEGFVVTKLEQNLARLKAIQQ